MLNSSGVRCVWTSQLPGTVTGAGLFSYSQLVLPLGCCRAIYSGSSKWVCTLQVSSSPCAALLLDYGGSRVTPATLTVVGVTSTTVWEPVQTGWRGSFFQSLTHTKSSSWYGWTQFPKGMGVLSRVSRVMCQRTLPKDCKCWATSKSAICLWSPLNFLTSVGGPPYRISKGI